MLKVKVYRSGVPAAPAERGCEKESYAAADAKRPEGRQGRTDGVFASPTLEGVVRWVRGNAMVQSWRNSFDYKVREITVDADSVYVYSVRAWEYVGGFRGEVAIDEYWATGMTLTEWLERGDLDPREWELLLSQEDMISVRPVGRARVAGAGRDEYERNELLDLLK